MPFFRLTLPRSPANMIESILNEFLITLNSFTDISDVPEEFSCQLLWKFVDGNGLQDDLLFFVSVNGNIKVCRHIPNQRPSLDIKVDWTASLVLNLICQTNYCLRITSCSYKEAEIPGIQHLVIGESTTKKVYASPIEELVDNFYDSNESLKSQNNSTYAFPDIYFSVQDYETCFENMKLGPDDILIVELFCSDTENTHTDATVMSDMKGSFYKKIDPTKVLFQGAISNKAIREAYQRNIKEFGTLKGSFIMMTGPDGIGEAQLHALDPNDNGDIDEIVLSAIIKTAKSFKRLIFDSKASKKIEQKGCPTSLFNCRLTYIRLHWKKLLLLIQRNWTSGNRIK